MTTNVCCCDANNDVNQATKLMSENQVRRIPVVDNNKIVGILTLGDLAKNEDITNQQVVNTFENICNCNHKNAE
jgi:predicted transcriptional regulator